MLPLFSLADLEKVNGELTTDNCKLEFSFAARNRGNQLIAVPMEPRCLNISLWDRTGSGGLGAQLGANLYVANFASNDAEAFEKNLDLLYDEICRVCAAAHAQKILAAPGVSAAASATEEAIRAAISDAAAFSRACGAMDCSSPERQAALRTDRAPGAVVAGMGTHDTDRSAQFEGLRALNRLAKQPDGKCDLELLTAVPQVVTAMRNFAADGAVQLAGCLTLQTLCLNASNKPMATASRAFEVVVAAMRAFPASPAIQEAAIRALRSATGTVDASRALVADAGGLEAITAAMVAHGASESLQEAGCAALRNFAGREATRKRAIAAGAAESLSAAMRAHAGLVALQEGACWAISLLASGRDDAAAANARRARLASTAAGAVDAIVSSMGRHRASVPVQQAGCVALKCLGALDANRPRMAASGAIAAVVAAMRAHKDAIVVQEAREMHSVPISCVPFVGFLVLLFLYWRRQPTPQMVLCKSLIMSPPLRHCDSNSLPRWRAAPSGT